MAKTKNEKKFNVLLWDFNSDQLVHYDVLPYFRRCLEENSKRKNYKKKVDTPEDLKKFVESESHYRYWSRCEYEMICHGWPAGKNDYKIDVHEQVEMNIDTIVDILWEEIKN